ncbi:MAG: polysaccharide biosynthesis C-terminal domain-containing protein [Clostridia bacterium]
MNSKTVIKNAIFGFGGQFLITLLGIVVPWVVIKSYGSDVNGLLNTVTQIFTYMALLEAGIGSATRNALYKPFAEKNKGEISHIASASQSYFRRVSVVYIAGVILLAVVSPYVIISDIDNTTVSLVVLFHGLSGALSFYFIQTKLIILRIEGKGYVINSVTLVHTLISYTLKIVLAYYAIDIVILQISYFLVALIQTFFYSFYFKKHYAWISLKPSKDKSVLKDRNAYVITEIAWTIFSATDLIVLSTFVSTKMASVYSVYNMVFINLSGILNSIFVSTNYILGRTYHENIEKYKTLHDTFNSVYFGAITILMSCCYVLTLPFVSLYTDGVNDINYIYSELPLMFCLVQLISWSRYISGNLTSVAGLAKQTSYVSLVEAIINVFLSVILVRRYGISGVLFATVIALPIKVIYCTYVTERKVLRRSLKKTITILGTNALLFIVVVITSRYIPISINSFGEFILKGALVFVVFSAVGILINYIINPSCINIVKSLKKR